MNQNYKIRALMYERVFNELAKDMKEKGSRVEAGFLLLGFDIGDISLFTDYVLKGQGGRTGIDIPRKGRIGILTGRGDEVPIDVPRERELQAKLQTMNALEKACYLPPSFELGGYERIKKMGFSIPKDAGTLPDGTLVYQLKRIVGNAHTHPDIGAFLSQADMTGIREFLESARRTPATYTKNPWVEIVYDPVRNQWAVFESLDGRSSRVCELFIGNPNEINKFLR